MGKIDDSKVDPANAESIRASLREATQSVLAGLTPREADRLKKRFGIKKPTDAASQEVGTDFDETREH